MGGLHGEGQRGGAGEKRTPNFSAALGRRDGAAQCGILNPGRNLDEYDIRQRGKNLNVNRKVTVYGKDWVYL